MWKKPPVNAGDARDVSSIPESGRSPGEEMATHSSTLAGKIPWTEEPDRLLMGSPGVAWGRMGSQRFGHD